MELLLASGNPKKLAELSALAARIGATVRVPSDVGGLPDVVEDGDTFEANAAKKAASGARASGLPCVADDSGLAVDALGGAPGVRSARWAGAHGDDAANNAKVLRETADVPRELRGARFVCAIAVADPSGAIAAEARGEVRGRLLTKPRGDGGFGYDPLFEYDEPDGPADLVGRSFGELSAEDKARVSHRARALRALAPALERLAAAGSEEAR